MIVSEVIASNPGITISPTGETMFVVLLEQVAEMDASGKEIYSFFIPGLDFTLTVLLYFIALF